MGEWDKQMANGKLLSTKR